MAVRVGNLVLPETDGEALRMLRQHLTPAQVDGAVTGAGGATRAFASILLASGMRERQISVREAGSALRRYPGRPDLALASMMLVRQGRESQAARKRVSRALMEHPENPVRALLSVARASRRVSAGSRRARFPAL